MDELDASATLVGWTWVTRARWSALFTGQGRAAGPLCQWSHGGQGGAAPRTAWPPVIPVAPPDATRGADAHEGQSNGFNKTQPPSQWWFLLLRLNAIGGADTHEGQCDNGFYLTHLRCGGQRQHRESSRQVTEHKRRNWWSWFQQQELPSIWQMMAAVLYTLDKEVEGWWESSKLLMHNKAI